MLLLRTSPSFRLAMSTVGPGVAVGEVLTGDVGLELVADRRGEGVAAELFAVDVARSVANNAFSCARFQSGKWR
jgi:hypothetical protein